MINIALFVIFSGFSLNLVIQFGFGFREIIAAKPYLWKNSLFQGLILFFTVLFIWIVFRFLIISIGLGFLETLVLLPCSIIFASIIERGTIFLCSRRIQFVHSGSVFSAYNGLIFGAVFFTVKFAESFTEALIMALGFSLGYVLSMAILQEIHKRSVFEAVPKSLRGAPLLLFTLGLLSLVCSAAAVYFLQMIDM